MKEREAHTPGPLVAKKGRDYSRLQDKTGRIVANVVCLKPGDANHLAACWNALEGMDPEAVGEVVKFVRALADGDLGPDDGREQRISALARSVLAKLDQ